ncbi:hypothetical protein DGWBC_1579 [Dehalogenimonas sp. WBC-2]|nr:hypothetical protein DGWBC_1579 [Dehalogenimonas sp. WBC-2]
MSRSIFVIKAVHTAIFWFMIGCFAWNLYAAATGTFSWLLAVTYGSHILEGVALAFNNGTCPLRTMAEKHGAQNGAVTDIFLPQWLASRIFIFGMGMFIVETAWLIISYFTR